MFNGKWKNQLGSVIELKEQENNTIVGKYWTAVGNAEYAKIIGSYQKEQFEGSTSLLITFMVHWVDRKDPKKPPSCTVWTGQGIFENEVLKAIDTTWLLRRFTKQKLCWDGVLINKDYFVKQ